MHFWADPLFNAANVQGCAAHITLFHGTNSQDKSVLCTSDARTKPQFDSLIISWPNAGIGSYRLEGWVNIQTTKHYNGYPFRSPVYLTI